MITEIHSQVEKDAVDELIDNLLPIRKPRRVRRKQMKKVSYLSLKWTITDFFFSIFYGKWDKNFEYREFSDNESFYFYLKMKEHKLKVPYTGKRASCVLLPKDMRKTQTVFLPPVVYFHDGQNVFTARSLISDTLGRLFQPLSEILISVAWLLSCYWQWWYGTDECTQLEVSRISYPRPAVWR